jgi:Nucleotidyl transferase AbiEii toxin, Type IV TA system
MTSNGEISLPYKTTAAFSAAITAHLKSASQTSGFTPTELRRQFAYDRLLQRIFAHEPYDWVLKGGGGMLARIPQAARHSMDLDMFYDGNLHEAMNQLRVLASQDAGDFFDFHLLTGRTIGERGTQIAVNATLDNRTFERFSIDLVVVSNMTQDPDTIQPLSPLSIEGLSRFPYRVYPVVDHLADKHAAILETHRGVPSSRYRDLVDITIIATTQRIDSAPLRTAVISELAYRNISMPETFTVPSTAWRNGYETLVKNLPRTNAPATLQDALAIAGALLNPILNGTADGQWNPDLCCWEPIRTNTN